MPELARLAARFEQLGYSDIWVPDERLLRNVYVALATVAGATSRVGLGPAVTNPYTRHPAHTAAAIATIDELSGGRATLAFGAGGGLNSYGIARAKAAATLREAIEIVRALLAGQRVTYQGEVFSLHQAGIDFRVARPVPIYLAGRGPRILTLAGELADGAVIGGFATPAGIAYAQGQINDGERRAGRAGGSVDQMAWLYTCVADDVAAARTAVARMVLASLITSRPILDQLGIQLPAALRVHLDATGWRYPTESDEAAARLLPDDIIEAFALFGSVEDCRRRLAAIRQCGIDHVAFVPFVAQGDTLDQVVERIASGVVGDDGRSLPPRPPTVAEPN